MKKCSSYHDAHKNIFTYDKFTGNCDGCYSVPVGVCWGTKECEECHCGGDKSKCDFYPEVRENAKTDDAITVETYEAMFKDLEFRTKQVRELQEENTKLKEELNFTREFIIKHDMVWD